MRQQNTGRPPTESEIVAWYKKHPKEFLAMEDKTGLGISGKAYVKLYKDITAQQVSKQSATKATPKKKK